MRGPDRDVGRYERPEHGALAPKPLNGSPVTIHLWVEDVDAFAAQAVRVGAKTTILVTDSGAIATAKSKIRLATVGRSSHMFAMSRRLRQVSSESVELIHRALLRAGIEFIDENGGGSGVRLRKHQRPKRPKWSKRVGRGSSPGAVLGESGVTGPEGHISI